MTLTSCNGNRKGKTLLMATEETNFTFILPPTKGMCFSGVSLFRLVYNGTRENMEFFEIKK